MQPCTWIAFAARTFPLADFFVQFVAGWGALKLEAFRQRKPLRKRWLRGSFIRLWSEAVENWDIFQLGHLWLYKGYLRPFVESSIFTNSKKECIGQNLDVLLFARPKFLKGTGQNMQLFIRAEAMRQLTLSCCLILANIEGTYPRSSFLSNREAVHPFYMLLNISGQNMESQQCGDSCLCGRHMLVEQYTQGSIQINDLPLPLGICPTVHNQRYPFAERVGTKRWPMGLDHPYCRQMLPTGWCDM